MVLEKIKNRIIAPDITILSAMKKMDEIKMKILFVYDGDKFDMQRFASLGVVEQTTRHDMEEVDTFFEKLEGIFDKEDFTKAQVVDAIKEFIPNFEHEEKGKYLDQKM